MFEFVRSNTRLLQFLLLLLIVPSFVFFGVQGYSRFTEGAQATVATVDGRAITQAEWDLAHQRQAERMRRQMPNLDAKFFDQPQMKRETLDALVRERVLFAAVNDRHLAVGDERLKRIFATDPQFAQLRNPDNTINKALLEAQGMSSELFVQQLRQELTLQQVTQPLAESVIAADTVTKQGIEALLQKREAQLQRFETKDYAAKVNPSDAEVEAYYKSHEADFRAPEQATIEYVVLDLDTLKKGTTVSEEDLRKYYDENMSRYTSAEERRASHILVKADKDAPAAEKQKAKAKAEALLAELRKKPAAFAELAKKNSDDPGSGERGGDLDYFGRGAMVKPFEDAAFAMKPGEISNVVESDFGYHIIRLDAVRGGEKKPFDAVRASIEDEVKKQLAQKRYSEAAEQFTNTVYEQPESLQPVIDKLKLQKQTATVMRTPAAGASGPLASPKLLELVFGNDAVKNKRNTDAVEVGPNQMASARIVQHTPARTLPLADVKEQVRQRVVLQQAATLARKDGEARLAQLKQGGDAAALPNAVTVSRSQSALPRPLVDAVLRADASKLPATIGVDLGDAGYVVARIVKVEPPALQGEELKQLQAGYARAWGAAEGSAYYEALKRRYKVEIKAAAPAADAALVPPAR
jgi:peptidyl-prolyl cis-trans isomerase D